MFADDNEAEESATGATRYPVMPSLVALQQMRSRLHMAQLGRKLMKWTSVAAAAELRRISADLQAVYKTFAEDMREAFILLARCRYFFLDLNKMVVNDLQKGASVTVSSSVKTVSGVRIIQYRIVETDTPYDFLGLGAGGETIEEAKKAWVKLLKLQIRMVELRRSFLIVEEVHKTATKHVMKMENRFLAKVLPTITYTPRFAQDYKKIKAKLWLLCNSLGTYNANQYVVEECKRFPGISKQSKVFTMSSRYKIRQQTPAADKSGDHKNIPKKNCTKNFKLVNDTSMTKKSNEIIFNLTNTVQFQRRTRDSLPTIIVMMQTNSELTGCKNSKESKDAANSTSMQCSQSCPSNDAQSNCCANDTEEVYVKGPKVKKVVRIKKHTNDDGTVTIDKEIITITTQTTNSKNTPDKSETNKVDSLSASSCLSAIQNLCKKLSSIILLPKPETKKSCGTSTEDDVKLEEDVCCVSECCSLTSLTTKAASNIDNKPKFNIAESACPLCATQTSNASIECPSKQKTDKKTCGIADDKNAGPEKSRSCCSIKIILKPSFVSPGGPKHKKKSKKNESVKCPHCKKLKAPPILSSASKCSQCSVKEAPSQSSSLCIVCKEKSSKKSLQQIKQCAHCTVKKTKSKRTSSASVQCCGSMQDTQQSISKCPQCAAKQKQLSQSSSLCPVCKEKESKKSSQRSPNCPQCKAKGIKLKEPSNSINSSKSRSMQNCKVEEKTQKKSSKCSQCSTKEMSSQNQDQEGSANYNSTNKVTKGSFGGLSFKNNLRDPESKCSCNQNGKDNEDKDNSSKTQNSSPCPMCKDNNSKKSLQQGPDCLHCKAKGIKPKQNNKIEENTQKSCPKCPQCSSEMSSQKQDPKDSEPLNSTNKVTNRSFGGFSFKNNLRDPESKCACNQKEKDNKDCPNCKKTPTKICNFGKNTKQDDGSANSSPKETESKIDTSCCKKPTPVKTSRVDFNETVESKTDESCNQKGKDDNNCPNCKKTPTRICYFGKNTKQDDGSANSSPKRSESKIEPCHCKKPTPVKTSDAACQCTPENDIIDLKKPCVDLDTNASIISTCTSCQSEASSAKDDLKSCSSGTTSEKESGVCTPSLSIKVCRTHSDDKKKTARRKMKGKSKNSKCPVCLEQKCSSDFSLEAKRTPPKHKCKFAEEPKEEKQKCPVCAESLSSLTSKQSSKQKCDCTKLKDKKSSSKCAICSKASGPPKPQCKCAGESNKKKQKCPICEESLSSLSSKQSSKQKCDCTKLKDKKSSSKCAICSKASGPPKPQCKCAGESNKKKQKCPICEESLSSLTSKQSSKQNCDCCKLKDKESSSKCAFCSKASDPPKPQCKCAGESNKKKQKCPMCEESLSSLSSKRSSKQKCDCSKLKDKESSSKCAICSKASGPPKSQCKCAGESNKKKQKCPICEESLSSLSSKQSSKQKCDCSKLKDKESSSKCAICSKASGQPKPQCKCAGESNKTKQKCPICEESLSSLSSKQSSKQKCDCSKVNDKKSSSECPFCSKPSGPPKHKCNFDEEPEKKKEKPCSVCSKWLLQNSSKSNLQNKESSSQCVMCSKAVGSKNKSSSDSNCKICELKQIIAKYLTDIVKKQKTTKDSGTTGCKICCSANEEDKPKQPEVCRILIEKEIMTTEFRESQTSMCSTCSIRNALKSIATCPGPPKKCCPKKPVKCCVTSTCCKQDASTQTSRSARYDLRPLKAVNPYYNNKSAKKPKPSCCCKSDPCIQDPGNYTIYW